MSSARCRTPQPRVRSQRILQTGAIILVLRAAPAAVRFGVLWLLFVGSTSAGDGTPGGPLVALGGSASANSGAPGALATVPGGSSSANSGAPGGLANAHGGADVAGTAAVHDSACPLCPPAFTCVLHSRITYVGGRPPKVRFSGK